MRFKFQFRLKWLLVFIAVVAVPLSWLKWRLEEKRAERKAVAEVLGLGGGVGYSDGERFTSNQSIVTASPPGPAWLRRIAGNDFFMDVDWVWFRNHQFDLPNQRPPPITDDGLVCLRQLPRLKTLILEESLSDAPITDGALVHLSKLKSLTLLELGKTHISDAGVADLHAALPRCTINGRGPWGNRASGMQQ